MPWGTHYTYTNSVILNETVLVCQFNGYPTQNAQAVSVFEEAMPFHDIVPINCSGIIGQSGAIHCIVKHVPEVVLFRDTFDGHSY
jgi:agmatine deiminase